MPKFTPVGINNLIWVFIAVCFISLSYQQEIELENTLIAFSILVASWKYFDTKERELNWKRTELLFSLLDRFEEDEKMSRAAEILAGRNSKTKIDDLYQVDGKENSSTHGASLEDFDHLFGYLLRLTYAVNNKSLTDVELGYFSWYFQTILNKSRLTKYCQSNGYADVVAYAAKI